MNRATGDLVGEFAGFAQVYAPNCVITPNHNRSRPKARSLRS